MGNDGTVMDVLLEREALTGVPDPRVAAARIPDGLDYLWEAWLALHRTTLRPEGGRNPITYQDIVQYADAYRIRFSEWEVDAIIDIDAAVMSAQAQEDAR